MTSLYSAMCADLLRSLENYPIQPPRDRDLCLRVRALLDQPVAEVPTDEDLDAFIYGFFFEDDWYYNTEMERGLARAVLAKWGHPTPHPPAAGEVAELVRWLLAHADEHTEEPDGPYTRAADLLQHQHPQPVAPTVMEIIELHTWMEDEWRANNDGEDLPMVDYARAVLAKWGNQ